MITGNPMTTKSQLAIVVFVLLAVLLIIRLLQQRKINESLFYLWFIIFIGIFVVAISHGIQMRLAAIIGSYSALSTMLFLALGFLFLASLMYSVLISNLNVKLREMTSYIATMRLDVDDLQKRTLGDERSRKGDDTQSS